MAKVKNVKLKVDCLMQWLGSLKRKPKSVVKENVERFVPIKGFKTRQSDGVIGNTFHCQAL